MGQLGRLGHATPPPPHAHTVWRRHNNHHAFEFSARHGLEWWQFDMTWMVIRALQSVGLATNVKLPSDKQKERLAFPDPAPAAA